MRYRVGCVPYLNAKPLVRFLHEPGSAVEVVYDVPSRLPALLESGEVQAILVSSVKALRNPCRVVDGIAIATRGAVKSVRLFSKVPLENVQRLALDQSSMTSNLLAQLLVGPNNKDVELVTLAPDLDRMLEEADACVLIGDNGMRDRRDDLQVVDLGQGWTELTGLPFVWAVWVGDVTLPSELANRLRESASWGRERLDEIVPTAAQEAGFSFEEADDYLRNVMDYDLSSEHKSGLREFGTRLVQARLIENAFEPFWV